MEETLSPNFCVVFLQHQSKNSFNFFSLEQFFFCMWIPMDFVSLVFPSQWHLPCSWFYLRYLLSHPTFISEPPGMRLLYSHLLTQWRDKFRFDLTRWFFSKCEILLFISQGFLFPSHPGRYISCFFLFLLFFLSAS